MLPDYWVCQIRLSAAATLHTEQKADRGNAKWATFNPSMMKLTQQMVDYAVWVCAGYKVEFSGAQMRVSNTRKESLK